MLRSILFLIASLAAVAEPTFKPLFDGKSLTGWDGDPTYWRVENGCIVGEVTPETLLDRNSFLIWQGGEPANFELEVEYRVSARGNSGINYRSKPTPNVKWALTGYQGDIEGGDRWTGQNYEERGRKFLAYRGQSVVLKPSENPELIKELGDPAELQKSVKKEGWNLYRIVADGPLLRHYVNGVLMSEVRDLDPENRTGKGRIGVQVHVGPPMKIEYRAIRLKELGPGKKK